MNYLDRVQKGIDFIEANLDAKIKLKHVAQVACISQWHFQRIFKALTNETLKNYIRSRRLSNAMDKLLNTQERIVDIALISGFESQESFTRAFTKHYGLTPNDCRKMTDKNRFLKKIQFNQNYLKHINQNLSLEPQIYQQKPMQLVGMKTLFYSSDSEKNNIADKLPVLWQEFLPQLAKIPHRIPNVCYGIIQQTQEKTDLLEYFAVAEVSKTASIPQGMVGFTLPESRYAKFTHKGVVNTLDNTVNYIYSSWLLQSKYQHNYQADIEIYGEKYHPTAQSSEMHYAIPIKELTRGRGHYETIELKNS